MTSIDKKELREIRKQKFAQMEQQLKEIHPKEEDSIFYYHSSEDRIILSHALFWTMTLPQYFKSKLRKLMASHLREEKDSRRLAAISVVAAGFGGDMPEELATILIDDIDYHYNKVKCRAIEHMMPKLMKMVEGEMEGMKGMKGMKG